MLFITLLILKKKHSFCQVDLPQTVGRGSLKKVRQPTFTAGTPIHGRDQEALQLNTGQRNVASQRILQQD